MIRQCFILFGCLAIGEFVVWLTNITVPSSIIGMLTLTFFLKTGIVKLDSVKGMADFLVANLAFFFVPPGVALMQNFDLIAGEFWQIVIAAILSTVFVMLAAGWMYQLTDKLISKWRS